MTNESIIKGMAHAGDHGPIYTETDFSRLIVEPFNALSAFLFIIIAGYWFIRLWGQYKKHKFLTYIIILLTIGGIGGTIYHAFRYHQIFLFMDWIPIALIIFSMSFYFFQKSLKKWWIGIILIVLMFGLNIINFMFFDIARSINLSYTMMGLTAAIPIFITLYKTKFYKWSYVAGSVSVMILAVLSRTFDKYLAMLLPMGTHFMWHLFGAIGTQFILLYIYHLDFYKA